MFKKLFKIIAVIGFVIPVYVFAAPFLPFQGGTGTSTKPTLGQLLMGNSSGTYDLVATSSLGVGGTPAGSTGQIQYNNGGVFGASSGFVYATTTGNVGIGTSSPLSKLSIQGTGLTTGEAFEISDSAGAPKFTVLDNGVTTLSSTLNGITFLTPNTNSFYAVSGGTPSVTTGTENTAIGYQALSAVTGTYRNTAVGYQAAKLNTGYYNTVLGARALSSDVSGWYSTAIGYNALNKATGGTNTAVGAFVLGNTTSGTNNTAIGLSAMKTNVDGAQNTAIGGTALYSNTSGSGNTAIGFQSLYTNAGGSDNVGIGMDSLRLNVSGIWNMAIGTNALENTTGNRNTAVGVNAGTTNTSGTNNTFIGQAADAGSSGLTNATAIGYGAIVGASNSLVLGGTGASAVNVGIGTSSPIGKFTISTTTTNASFNIDTDGILETKYGIYCELYDNDNGTAQSIPTGATYTKSTALASTTMTETKYCDADAANQQLVITKPGKYRVMGTFSLQSGTANVKFVGALFVGGVEQHQIHWHGKTIAAGDESEASFTGFFTATSSSVVDMRVRHDNGGNVDFTIEYGNLNIEYVGN